MPNTPPPPVRPPWWFRLVRHLLNLALISLLCLQVFVLVVLGTEKHLSLPDFVLRTLEDQLQAQGLRVHFNTLEVSLSGRLQVRDAQIFLTGTTEPVVEADYLEIEPAWFTLWWSHRLEFSEARLAGANFYCPPENSPTGEREALVEHLDAGLASQGGNWWRLDHVWAHFLGVRVYAQGNFRLPAAPPAGAPMQLAASYRQVARNLASLRPQIALVKNPLVDIKLDSDEPGQTKIQVSLLADGAQPPVAGLKLGKTSAQFILAWDGTTLQARGPATAWTESVHYQPDKTKGPDGEIFSSQALWVRAQLAEGPAGVLSGWPARVMISADVITVGNFHCDALTADADLHSWPSLPLSAMVVRGTEWVKLAAQTQWDATGEKPALQSAALDFQTQAELASLLAVGQVQLPKELASLKFDEALHLAGHVVVNPGWQLASVDFSAQTGGSHFQLINLDALQAQGRLARTAEGAYALDLTQATLRNESWEVKGSYAQNFGTQDFRLFVHGDLDPKVLDPYLGFWWKPIWQFIEPHGQWPQAEVEYAGNWHGPEWADTLFVSAQVAGARSHGIPLESIRVQVAQEPGWVAVYDLAARAAGGGELTGALLWLMKPPYTHLYEQRFMFNSTLPLNAIGAIGGPEVAAIVRPLASTARPIIQVDQRLGGSANPQPAVESTKVHAEFTQPFRAYGVPFDKATVDATAYDGLTEIPQLSFGLAEGAGVGQAKVIRDAVGAEQLTFKVLLQNAQHTGFLSALGDFNAEAGSGAAPAAAKQPAVSGGVPASSATAKSTNSMFGDLSKPGKLDLTLGGKFTLGQPNSLLAEGAMRIRNADLGQLQLLGGLSRFLADTKIPLGDFALHDAESNFQLAGQYLRLPDLVVTGPSARLEAAGIYNFGNGNLDFNTLIFPIGQWDSGVLKELANLANPFSNTITLKLHGQVAKPDWSISMNPLRLFEDRTVEGPGIPGWPVDNSGAAVLPLLPKAEPLPAAPVAPKPGVPNLSN